MPRRKKRKNVWLLVALIIVIGVAGSVVIIGLAPLNLHGTAPTPVVVTIPQGAGLNIQLGFAPSLIKLVIGVNNTVIWKNEDTVWHTAHSNIPEFDSKMIPPGTSFTHTFLKSGSFPYHCDPHPWMTGLVIVSGSNPVYAQRTLPVLMPLQITPQFLLKASDGTKL